MDPRHNLYPYMLMVVLPINRILVMLPCLSQAILLQW